MIFRSRVLGFYRLISPNIPHKHTTMLNAHPTIFCFRVSGSLSSFRLLRLCETPPSPPASDPVGIENCKQLFSPLLAFTTQKIATRSTDIISAARVAFFWVVNATRNEKSCIQFLIPTVVFHMLLNHLAIFIAGIF